MASKVTDEEGRPAQEARTFGDLQAEAFAGGMSFSGYERDLVALNGPDGRFIDISGISGADSVSDGRGTVFADFDNDGDTDIFLRAMHGEAHHLFRNNVGADGNFVRIALEGTASGRDAFGAEVRLWSGGTVEARVKSGGTGFVSQSDPRLLYGLGELDRAERLEVRWPSGLVQTFDGPAAGDSWLLREGEAGPVVVKEKRFGLPAPASADVKRFHSFGLNPDEELVDITVTDLDGESRSLSSYVAPGRSLVLNLWATWCRPCAAEMPELQKLAEEGAAVLGLSIDREETRGAIPAALDRFGVTYPIATVDGTELERLLGTADPGVPLSIVVDDELRPIRILVGWNEETRSTLAALR